MIPKCLITGCQNQSAPALKRGLCMKCYSRAKALVDCGTTTWNALAARGLCLRVEDDVLDPFTLAFNSLQIRGDNANNNKTDTTAES